MNTPLFDLDASAEERYLVSLLLSFTTRFLRDQALETVTDDDFGNGTYAGIWAAARKLRANGKRIDVRALVAEADGRGVDAALSKLAGVVPAPGDYPAAVAAVQRTGKLRRLHEALSRGMQLARDSEDYSSAYDRAVHELTKLATAEDSTDTRSLGELIDRFTTALAAPEKEYTIIPTPWAEMNDRMAGGLHGGRLYVIGARPGEGKSISAHNIAQNAASQGHPTLIFSMEMGDMEVTGRLISDGAAIEMGEISRRQLSAYSYDQLTEYADRARDYPLYVNDRATMNLAYIRSECRAQKRRTGLDVVVVDYGQLIKPERSNVSRQEQVATICRGLKELSRELDAAVIVPAQLNRESARRGRPALEDLKESGEFEAAADIVILMARQFHPPGHEAEGKPTGQVLMDFAKNRHGQVGGLMLDFRGHYSRIG